LSSDLTIVFFPEGAFGPTNNCVGIADVLRARGVRCVFVVEESFAGTLEAKGFEEARMRLKPAPEVEEEPGQFWKDFVRDTAPEFRKPTIEQLSTFIKPVWEELVDGAKYAHPRLEEIFADLGPDLIVEDNVVAFPAVLTSGVPWVRIVSCNPLEMKDPSLPPTFSGYPTDDQTGWDEFRGRYREVHEELHEDFSNFCMNVGAPRLPEGEFIWESPLLDLYLYPQEADYRRSRPLAPAWNRIESCVRATDDDFELPSQLRSGKGKLVYLSLGSLGSADVDLMNRLVGVLADTPHRYIVSKGPQHELIDLADNMWGSEFLPQPSILPQVDLVITHGGNNTVTECLHFGKPMVVLPLFWDQYDNAQRVDELGFGVRLPTYDFAPRDLTEAIDRLTSDDDLRGRMRNVASRLQSSPGTVRAADLIQESVSG
jgi:UDP:flavonoid glycosyltransferase YjiC (YdhE family)